MIWITIAILALLVILAVLAIKLKTKQKLPTDYYSFFIIGLIWTSLGIIMEFFIKDFSMGWFFLIVGIAYIIIGISHKKDWEKNRKANQWKNLSRNQKNFQSWAIIILSVLVTLGVIASLLFI